MRSRYEIVVDDIDAYSEAAAADTPKSCTFEMHFLVDGKSRTLSSNLKFLKAEVDSSQKEVAIAIDDALVIPKLVLNRSADTASSVRKGSDQSIDVSSLGGRIETEDKSILLDRSLLSDEKVNAYLKGEIQ